MNISESEHVKQTAPEEIKEVSDSAGFADADALASAYKSLQAEFTRRSQRLKVAEKELEKLRAVADTEELQQSAAVPAPAEEPSDFEQFLKQFPEADAEAVVKGAVAAGDFKRGGLTREYVRSLRGEIAALKEENSSEEAIAAKALASDKVTEEIVKAYLKGIKGVKDKQPPKIVGEAPKTPPSRPKTIAEAGLMAGDIFKYKQ